MTKLENEFLENYIEIDNFIKDKLKTNQGVTDYISLLEKYDLLGKEYKEIKHLRWVRNKLVHEPDFNECEKDDLENLLLFKKELYKGSDVLSLYYKSKKTKARPKSSNSPSHNSSKKNSNKFIKIIIYFAILILLLYLTKILN